MKRLLIIFLLSSAFQVQAQDTADSTVSMAADTAAAFTGNRSEPATAFKPGREKMVYRRVFKVNTAKTDQKVFDRALGFARMHDADYKSSKKDKTISFPVQWTHQGRANECVENLVLKGTVTVEVKNLKSRISLTDITYIHSDKPGGDQKGIAKSDLLSRKPDCAPSSGAVELIYSCSQCRQSTSHVTSSVEDQFEQLASQYQERLKKY
ncbi:MAG: hypothetical protein EOP56_19240 [Sphingobacteriales bacterium]|nr:MAG: hypothetical protein EOP56_19240 [Sphingobacteriales bacterium]